MKPLLLTLVVSAALLNPARAQEPAASLVPLALPGDDGICFGVDKIDHEAMRQKFGEIRSYMYIWRVPGTGSRVVTLFRDSLNRTVSFNDMVTIPDSSGRPAGTSLMAVRTGVELAGFHMPLVDPATPRPSMPKLIPLTAQELARVGELADWVYEKCRRRPDGTR